jgi:hypothetical protein
MVYRLIYRRTLDDIAVIKARLSSAEIEQIRLLTVFYLYVGNQFRFQEGAAELSRIALKMDYATRRMLLSACT